MAQTSGLTQSATGSFPKVTGVTAASTGDYTLQLNTNLSQASAATCKALGGYPSCQTWEQFIYATTYYPLAGGSEGPSAFIQNWIFISSSYNCPQGWDSYAQEPGVTGCYKNSSAVSVGDVALENLGNVELSGSASTGGNDTVTFTNGATAKSVSQSGATLYIGSTWNQSEFNVVGDGGGSGVSFNSGSSLTVKIQVNDGTANAPTCVNQGETGETNNLNLGACAATAPTNGGSTPTPGNIVAANSGLCLNVSGNTQDTGVVQSACGTTGNLEWELVPVGSYYHIVAQGSGQCLNVPGNSTANGTQLIQWPCQAASSDNDQWSLVATGSHYHIVSRSSGLCVNINGGSSSAGAEVIQWPCQGSTTTNDQFTVPSSSTTTSSPGYIQFTESN
jgi:hypothetical protein